MELILWVAKIQIVVVVFVVFAVVVVGGGGDSGSGFCFLFVVLLRSSSYFPSCSLSCLVFLLFSEILIFDD